MTIKDRILGVGLALTGIPRTALAATNDTFLVPNPEHGRANLATLPYVDKLQWILDVVYAVVPVIAVLALGLLAVKYYTGGWDSVENELRTRKAFFMIIAVVLLLKVGSACINFISAW